MDHDEWMYCFTCFLQDIANITNVRFSKPWSQLEMRIIARLDNVQPVGSWKHEEVFGNAAWHQGWNEEASSLA
jgi:hypothetical protein